MAERERDMSSRINKARVAFIKLSKVWRSKKYGRKIKIKLYDLYSFMDVKRGR